MPGHHADGRDGDPPRREGGAPGVLQQAERARDAVEVVHRLAHAHEDQVRGAAAGDLGRAVDLLDDLARREVAGEAQRRRRAERRSRARSRPATTRTGSACRAAGGRAGAPAVGVGRRIRRRRRRRRQRWRRDASRAHRAARVKIERLDAVLVGDQHRLDGAAVAGAEAQLARAVGAPPGWCRPRAGAAARRRPARRASARGTFDIASTDSTTARASAVQPAEDLLAAVGRLAGRAHPLGELGGREGAQVQVHRPPGETSAPSRSRLASRSRAYAARGDGAGRWPRARSRWKRDGARSAARDGGGWRACRTRPSTAANSANADRSDVAGADGAAAAVAAALDADLRRDLAAVARDLAAGHAVGRHRAHASTGRGS